MSSETVRYDGDSEDFRFLTSLSLQQQIITEYKPVLYILTIDAGNGSESGVRGRGERTRTDMSQIVEKREGKLDKQHETETGSRAGEKASDMLASHFFPSTPRTPIAFPTSSSFSSSATFPAACYPVQHPFHCNAVVTLNLVAAVWCDSDRSRKAALERPQRGKIELSLIRSDRNCQRAFDCVSVECKCCKLLCLPKLNFYGCLPRPFSLFTANLVRFFCQVDIDT